MNTENIRSMEQNKGIQHGCTIKGILCGSVQELIYHGLSGDTHQKGRCPRLLTECRLTTSMYLPDITGAGPLLVGPAFFARQRLDLVPRLLLDVAGATFLVIALLFIGLNLYGTAYRAYSARDGAYRPRHARPRSHRGGGSLGYTYDRRLPRTGFHNLTTGKA